MKTILVKLREMPWIYSKLKLIYGKTIGLWYLKTLYLQYWGVVTPKKRVKLLTKKSGETVIAKKIKSGEPFMLARFGSTEFRNLVYEGQFELLCHYSGFFPKQEKLLKKFREVYTTSSKSIDFLVVWNYLNHFLKEVEIIKKLPNIEFLFPDNTIMHNSSWVKELKNKKVLVIHPFKKTIEHQYKIMDKLKILPSLKKLEVIQAVQTLAGNEDKRFKTWFDALEYMEREIDKKEFDIALIGCGAYGLPLAAYVKSRGKQAIHIGGGLQLLFGIIGKRWEDLIKVKTNKYWIRPLAVDILKNHKKIEGGCYW